MLNKRPGSIQVLGRAAALLNALTAGKRPMSLTELSRAVDLNKTTALNILATLVDLGFVTVSGETRQYRLGPFLLELGQAYESSIEIIEVAKPALRAVRDASGETATLHIRSGWERTCVAQETGLHPVRRVADLGRRRPLYSGAAGFTLLSSLADEEVRDYLRRTKIVPFTPQTITDERRILAAVREARANDYAAVFEDTLPGVSAVAVPIREHRGHVQAALVISGPVSRLDAAAVQAALPIMSKCAAEVSGQFGWPLRTVKNTTST